MQGSARPIFLYIPCHLHHMRSIVLIRKLFWAINLFFAIMNQNKEKRGSTDLPFFSARSPKQDRPDSPLITFQVVENFFSQDQSRTFKRSRCCRRAITLIAQTIEDVIISPVFRWQKAPLVERCFSNKVINWDNRRTFRMWTESVFSLFSK